MVAEHLNNSLVRSTCCESNHRRGSSGALGILDDLGLLAFHDSDTGVGGAQVNADDGPRGLAIAAEPQARLAAEQAVFASNQLGLDNRGLWENDIEIIIYKAILGSMGFK